MALLSTDFLLSTDILTSLTIIISFCLFYIFVFFIYFFILFFFKFVILPVPVNVEYKQYLLHKEKKHVYYFITYFVTFFYIQISTCMYQLFVLEPLDITENDVVITTNSNGVKIEINLSAVSGDNIDKIQFFLERAGAGAGAGTSLMLEVTLPLDACPDFILTGLQPDTEYIVTLYTGSGDQQSSGTQIAFRTGKFVCLFLLFP